MRHLFADTFYWVALFLPKDAWHERVMAFSRTLGAHHLTTTEDVLTEFLTFFSGAGSDARQKASALVRSVLARASVTVIPQSHGSFLQAFALYEARLDKNYSLVDCGSMEVMRQHRLTEVLTNDHHFTQEGFQVLFTEN
ncbi:MAG: type II toxin-antitoxin system VapC family toxin [Deltaproteobacteria bacterium]|nr:type II toxin-antitoxin system VapC family toxin [Deltaproteobacteria bacterium]